jgi:hypothetical protein
VRRSRSPGVADDGDCSSVLLQKMAASISTATSLVELSESICPGCGYGTLSKAIGRARAIAGRCLAAMVKGLALVRFSSRSAISRSAMTDPRDRSSQNSAAADS